MKKVLFATTALVASAGVAAADVTLSGSAEMGIFGGTGLETQFWTDIDVTFTLSGETDNGLTFGATIDLDEEGGFGATNGGPESVFISGAFGTLTMGDTDGAFDWAMTEVGIGTSLADDHTTHAGFNGNSLLDGIYDGQIARYEYSFGDFAFAVSAELDDTGVNDPGFAIGGTYSADMGGVALGVGLGYQEAAGGLADVWGASLSAAMDNGFEVRLNYSDWDFGGLDVTHIGIGAGYTMDALTISANWGQYDSALGDVSGYGLAVNYDLGGGAVVQFGYGNSDLGALGDFNTFSFGLAMSF